MRFNRNDRADMFDRLFFVTAALSRDSIKPILECLYVEPDRMVATDGHRLHIAENVGLEPGLYEVVHRNGVQILLYPVCNEDFGEILGYPEFDRAIPDYEAEGLIRIKLDQFADKDSPLDYCRVVRTTADLPEPDKTESLEFIKMRSVVYNYSYFQESKRSMVVAIFNPQKPLKPLVMLNDNQDRLALLMPIRGEDE